MSGSFLRIEPGRDRSRHSDPVHVQPIADHESLFPDSLPFPPDASTVRTAPE